MKLRNSQLHTIMDFNSMLLEQAKNGCAFLHLSCLPRNGVDNKEVSKTCVQSDEKERSSDIVHGSVFWKSCAFHHPIKIMTIDGKRTKLPVATAYIITFGGGLISGDVNRFQVILDDGARLVILSQASTKVFRQKSQSVKKRITGGTESTRNCLCNASKELYETKASQYLTANVGSFSLLCLFPEPITPFQDAYYNQEQVISLHGGPDIPWSQWGSLAYLDWYTSGRRSRGEVWQFERYFNRLTIEFHDGTVFLRDFWNIAGGDQIQNSFTLLPFHVYGTFIYFGPMVESLSKSVLDEHKKLKVTATMSKLVHQKTTSSPKFIWSASPLYSRLGGEQLSERLVGVVVRMASQEVSDMRAFLNETIMNGLEAFIGENLFQRHL